MKYLGGFFVGLLLLVFGCNNNGEGISPIEQFDIDIKKIDNWIADNGITDTLVHFESFIRYTVNEVGTGISPRFQEGDSIVVDYKGWLLETGAVFESAIADSLFLDTTIRGWQIMLPEMREGDEFTIYLPSLYGYGTQGQGEIPPNAVIVFDIKLHLVYN